MIKIAALTFAFCSYEIYNLVMEFTKSLIKGKLIKRYKRFFTDVKIGNEIVTAHCPNTGSMKGLLDEDNEVYLLPNNDPKKTQIRIRNYKIKKSFSWGKYSYGQSYYTTRFKK